MRLLRAAPILPSVMLALSIVSAFAPSRADAQGPPIAATAPATGPAQQADELFLKGKALLKEGKKQGALAAYREAWKLRKSYDVAGNLGSLELELGLHRDAAEHLSYALSHYAASGTTKDQLDKARQRLETARKEVGALRIAVNVAGAEVLVDGVSAGHAPMTEDVFVVAGSHRVEARLAGHVPAAVSVEAKKGATEDVQLRLVPQPATATTATTATASGSASAPLTPRSKVPAYVAGGVGIASLIAGAALVGAAATMGDELLADVPLGPDGQPACRKTIAPGGVATAACDAWRARGAEASAIGNAGIGLFVIAGIAAAGVAGYLLWPSSPAPAARAATSWRLTPVMGPQGGGALLEGRF